MLHPTLETLFFLKIARNQVCESINDSDVDSKQELTSYIQNEASDYEVMHLITLGEMPEQKFDSGNELAVWEMFRRGIVENLDIIGETCRPADINTLIFEMGPVSDLGLSSAAPILEFARENGQLDPDALNEGSWEDDARKKNKAKRAQSAEVASWKKTSKSMKKAQHTSNLNSSPEYREKMRRQDSKKQLAGISADNAKKDWQKSPQGQLFKMNQTDRTNTAAYKEKMKKREALKGKAIQGGKYAGAAALGAAGIYGLYKAYKAWKAKRAAAKTPEAKAAAEKGMAKAQAKIKKAKKK